MTRRRDFLRSLLHGGAGAAATALAPGCVSDQPDGDGDQGRRALGFDPDEVVLPPPDATVQTTACAHCSIGCGYKVYTWPAHGPSGGIEPEANALGVRYPQAGTRGWISPEMHNVIDIEGAPHHVVIKPDSDATVVNVGGNHGIGASLARRLYPSDGAGESGVRDRLLRPQIRVGDELIPISWDAALDLVARTGRHVIDTRGALAWGMKTYSYQFYENTYAITKLAFEAVQTPCWAPHDKPAEGPDTPGLSDAGVNAFSAAYTDWRDADVLFASGVALYEAHGVLFDNWVAGGPTLIVVNPRRDEAAKYAQDSGGLFLQVIPGTDTALNNSIARVIIENWWEDTAWIEAHTAQADDLAAEPDSKWRRKRFGGSFEQYVESILGDPDTVPERAEEICGVPAADIRKAAELLAAPTGPGGERPAASFMLEKGNYWSHNYANSASFTSLGLLCGAGNRPGRVISRAGGHQRGMIKAAPYPEHLSPDTYDGHRIGLDLDRWCMEGNLGFMWVIGCTWAAGGSAATDVLYDCVKMQTRGHELPQLQFHEAFPWGADGPLNVDAVLASWAARSDAGGMVLVQQDLYPQGLTDLADLVLPAAGWGEEEFTRMQAERRLRSYAKIMDPPGEARPDWAIVSDVATRMGYRGFDWRGVDEVCAQAAQASAGAHAFAALYEYADARGFSARDVLRAAGTTGLQCPLSYERGDDELKETIRLHDAERGLPFSTSSGKAIFVRSSWADVLPRQKALTPRPGQLWVTNRRTSSNWSGLISDERVGYRQRLLQDNFLELHPQDAARLGLADGDRVRVSADDLADPSPMLDHTEGGFEAVARITDDIRPGVACTYFNFGGRPHSAANSVVDSRTEAITNKSSFKLGRGTIRRA